MLIRISGGSAGIREYLETGKKQGRAQSRTELDERVVLAGNLELVDAIIRSYASKGDRYLHITLSFREDEVDRATLEEIAASFESFAFAAYRKDEYAYYAEAHLPRTKSLTNQRTGKPEERKPHVHIVIPKVNLLTRKHLEPFGLVRMNKHYIDAWQEAMNLRYGLASPKEHPRVALLDRSDILARHKGDHFNGANKAFKAELLEAILATNVRSLEGLAALAGKSGSIRIRNEGREHEYLNVKRRGEAKGINLKEYVFSSAFLALPLTEKLEKLAVPGLTYVEQGEPGGCDAGYDGLLAEWAAVRSREAKYVFSGSRKAYRAYKDLPAEAQRARVDELERRYYEKADSSITIAREASTETTPGVGWSDIPEALSGALHPVVESEPPAANGPVDCVPRQLSSDARMEWDRREDEELTLMREVKKSLDPRRVLEELARTKGLLSCKYPVVTSDKGEARILCGKRRLNVADFLTKEIHLSWPEASDLLCSLFVQQIREGQDAERSPNEVRWLAYAVFAEAEARRIKANAEGEYLAWRASVKLERDAYREGKRLARIASGQTLETRKAELSLLAMEHLRRLDGLRSSHFAQVRSANLEVSESVLRRFCRYEDEEGAANLLAITGDGLDGEVAERTRGNGIMGWEEQRAHATVIAGTDYFFHKILKGGDVLYSRGGRQLLRDSGKTIWACEDSQEAAEACLRLALVKFGSRLRVVGSSTFKEAVAKAAAMRNMLVDFGDPGLNSLLRQEKRKIEAARCVNVENGQILVKAGEH